MIAVMFSMNLWFCWRVRVFTHPKLLFHFSEVADLSTFYLKSAEDIPFTTKKMEENFVLDKQMSSFRPSKSLIIKYRIYSSSYRKKSQKIFAETFLFKQTSMQFCSVLNKITFS